LPELEEEEADDDVETMIGLMFHIALHPSVITLRYSQPVNYQLLLHIVALLGRIVVVVLRRCGLVLFVTAYRRISVLSLSVTLVSPAKMAEPIEMSFGAWIRIGQGTIIRRGCTLAKPGEYNGTISVRRQCGLMPNYFDYLFRMPC